MKKSIMRFLGYFTYVIFLGYIVFKGTEYQRYLDKLAQSSFDFKPLYVFSSFFPVAIGILLAFPQFIRTFKMKGLWSFDWVKFIAIGLPAFYLTICPIALFPPFSQYFPKDLGRFMLMYSMVPHTISGIVFGYLIIDVLDKKQ